MLATLLLVLASAAVSAASPSASSSALSSSSSSSSVSVQVPLQGQLPLIARTDAPYSWSFAADSFVSSNNATLDYWSSALPDWLSFDAESRTLHGTPSTSDEGTPALTITAHDPVSDDTATSPVSICVTPYSPPQLHVSVADQFYATNPSLSSVFLLHKNSALASSDPTLRVPPKWSFSVGFRADTFVSRSDLYYAALQTDGSPLPTWLTFDPQAITFDGVTPGLANSTGPLTVALALHASDQQGYSAASVNFNLVVAPKELAMSTTSLPTINVTASNPFNFSLNSPDDFSGVELDGQPVQPSDIGSLDIDPSPSGSWLKYDADGRTLSGSPPADMNGGAQHVSLPVTLTSLNQTLHTNVSLAIVPSYFSEANIPATLALPGKSWNFSLVQYFSNNTGMADARDDVALTATFDPSSAADFLTFDNQTAQLTGTIPNNTALSSGGGNYSHITVTFTAYSTVTHSTSHASLPISLTTSDFSKQHKGGLSPAVRQKLFVIFQICTGVIGSIVSFCMGLAWIRRHIRAADSAVTGEEGERAWTAEEKKWYGIGIEVAGSRYLGPDGQQGQISHKDASPEPRFGTLQRVLTRTISNPSILPNMQSPGVLRKSEFVGRLRNTARVVSDTARGVTDICRRTVTKSARRPTISKPVLVMSSDQRVSATAGVDGLPAVHKAPHLRSHPLPFEDMDLSQYAPSGLTSVAASPSSSTGERSIPRRRADFGPPKGQGTGITPPLPVRTKGPRTSTASSIVSVSSTHTHEAEAVIQTATRTISIRSASVASLQDGRADAGRPRLVPFTSSSRVPVPKLPTSVTGEDDMSLDDEPILGSSAAGAKTKRVASQVARVFRGAPKDSERGDDLSVGIQYVRALGDDDQGGSIEQSPTGSFSLESSQHGHSTSQKIPIVPRMLARSGEQFKFRVPVSYSVAAGGPQKKQKALVARLMSDKPLPKFVRVNLDAVATGAGARVEKRVVEFWGTPGVKDVGELNVGVFEKEGNKCVGRVIIEVVERS